MRSRPEIGFTHARRQIAGAKKLAGSAFRSLTAENERMATYYKLTDKNFRTSRGTQWGEGVTHEVSGEGTEWIHFYLTPELAVLLNPIHADFDDPVLWEIQAEIEKSDGQLIVGSRKVTTVRQIPLQKASTEQRVHFAILCALEVYSEPSFVKWATAWIDNSDRSYRATGEVITEVEETTPAGAAAAMAVRAAAWAAEKGGWATRAAASAAQAAKAASACSGETLDLITIAKRALAASEESAATD
jgi:hypothetical protein